MDDTTSFVVTDANDHILGVFDHRADAVRDARFLVAHHDNPVAVYRETVHRDRLMRLWADREEGA